MTLVSTDTSAEVFHELCSLMPGGVNSPVRAAKGMGQLPLVACRGEADRIYDVTGKNYIDFCGSWGALIHGHAHPVIVEAIQQRALLGTTFGATTPLEGALSRAVLAAYPSMDLVRFVSSGTEATMSALRLARGFTGRDTIVKFSGNYHGHADCLLVQAGSGVAEVSVAASSAGVPAETVRHTACLPFNDIEGFRTFMSHPRNARRIAAVIVEPVAANMGVVPPAPGFLQALRQCTQEQGSLLIFDEVVTGFRLGYGGAQELYGITPDLTCLGKVVGGGLPAAAFGGRKEIMEQLAPIGPVYQAGTLSGNPLAMEAGLHALKLASAPGFYEELERKTSVITQAVREAIRLQGHEICLQQVGSMFTIFFGRKNVDNFEQARSSDMETFAKFFRYLFAHGVYIPPLQLEPWFISAAHSDENLLATRDVILAFFSML